MGLVKLVSQSLTKRNIQRLTQTYLTLSLGDIAANVGLASAQEAEMYILRWAVQMEECCDMMIVWTVWAAVKTECMHAWSIWAFCRLSH